MGIKTAITISVAGIIVLGIYFGVVQSLKNAQQENDARQERENASRLQKDIAEQQKRTVQPSPPSYQGALDLALRAAKAVQVAKTKEEWEAVVKQWEGAIAAMKTLPKSDSNYAVAQQKAANYQKNLEFAQKVAKTAKPSPKVAVSTPKPSPITPKTASIESPVPIPSPSPAPPAATGDKPEEVVLKM